MDHNERKVRSQDIKALKMLHQLRLDLAVLLNEGCDPDAAHLCTVVNSLTRQQINALADRSGVNRPSVETIDVLKDFAFLLAEMEERNAGLTPPNVMLRS